MHLPSKRQEFAVGSPSFTSGPSINRISIQETEVPSVVESAPSAAVHRRKQPAADNRTALLDSTPKLNFFERCFMDSEEEYLVGRHDISPTALKQTYLPFLEEARERWSDVRERKKLFIRAFLVVLTIAFLAVNAATTLLASDISVDCMTDKLHDWTSGLNTFFTSNIGSRNALLIVASGAMDLILFLVFIRWVVVGDSSRPVFSLIMLYSTRAIIQNLFLMKFPKGYSWGYPGFPSLAVPYAATSDFFYSGHVGFAVICSLELRAQGFTSAYIFGMLVVVLEAFTMIVLRGHYTIDLIAGLIFGHYFFIMGTHIGDRVDLRFGLKRRPMIPASSSCDIV
eukprot:GILJ01002190.1.p1 GENE.GILJ01002190.1~~GILJ01002190.1.p1  ORF type:complete len:340 (-),score=34.15 GILJ01002190.1:193-1212(-)